RRFQAPRALPTFPESTVAPRASTTRNARSRRAPRVRTVAVLGAPAGNPTWLTRTTIAPLARAARALAPEPVRGSGCAAGGWEDPQANSSATVSTATSSANGRADWGVGVLSRCMREKTEDDTQGCCRLRFRRM